MTERRFDPEDHDDGWFTKEEFIEYYNEVEGARRWASAARKAFPLGSTTVDLDAVARSAEVVLCDDSDGRIPGRALAVVLRDVDGTRGRHFLASAGIRLEDSNILPGSTMAMAGPNRTSSLTNGSTTSNDVFETLFNGTVQRPAEAVQLAREVMHIIERRRHGQGTPSSCIFTQPSEQLECTLRAHAFPPKDPAGAPPAALAGIRYGQVAGDWRTIRVPDQREGGRMHGHCDEEGTDGVVLLNLGSCDFFFCCAARAAPADDSSDDVESQKGKSAGSKSGCHAQRAHECWCVGGGGHWVKRDDAPKERYTNYSEQGGKGRPSLLVDRLCAKCAAGSQGTECRLCAQGTVRLRSGDMVIFSGTQAFHGVTRVVPELPPPLPCPQAPPLPAWVQSRLAAGWRLSVQWRLMNRAKAQEKQGKDMRAWHADRGIPSHPIPSDPIRSHLELQEDEDLQRGILASLEHRRYARGGPDVSRRVVISLDSDDEQPLAPPRTETDAATACGKRARCDAVAVDQEQLPARNELGRDEMRRAQLQRLS